MSNFFRDNTIGFKPRQNIFSKLRPSKELEAYETSDSSILDNPFFQGTDDTAQGLSPAEKAAPSKSSLVQSTPIRSQKRSKDEDEELEITEVREVSLNEDKTVAAVEEKFSETSTATTVNANNSSNDVLLEAFTNTQRICSSLKIELQRMQQKNSQQKDVIDQYKAETSKLTEKVQTHKALLNSLESHIKGLKQRKIENEASIKTLSSNYQTLHDKIKSLQGETDLLKGTINTNKSVQKNLETTIQQKNKELEYLKRELNECSGQLSEEKLKFSELLQQIASFKKDLSSEVKHSLEENMRAQAESIESFKEHVSQALSLVSNKIDSEASNFTKSLGDQTLKLTESNNAGMTSLQKYLVNSVQSAKLDLLTEDEKALSVSSLINEQLNKVMSTLEHNTSFQDVFMSSTMPEKFQLVTAALDRTRSEFKEVPILIQTILENIKTSEKYESRISTLFEELEAIKSKKSEVVNLLKEKDHEIEDLNNKTFQKSKDVDSLKTECDKLQTNIDELMKSNEQCCIESNKSKKESENHIVSLNCKLSAQLEINSLLEKELEQAKQEISTQIKAKEKILTDNECSKEGYENLQRQFQRINIELVQAKAKELELGEINRTLKEQLQETESNSVQIHSTVRELKDKVSMLEGEKTELNLEKLDLLDKVENLEGKLGQCRRQQSALDPPKKVQIPKAYEEDAFALSSDDLEMTNPEYPLQPKTIEPRKIHLKSSVRNRRKKLLLSDELDESPRFKKIKRVR